MDDKDTIDYESIRRRFPWVGVLASSETDLSTRYREIMAEAQRDRQIVDAIDEVRRIA